MVRISVEIFVGACDRNTVCEQLQSEPMYSEINYEWTQVTFNLKMELSL